MVFSTVLGQVMLALEPTARNSNLLPVNANGDVRLRSPASFGSGGGGRSPGTEVPPFLLRVVGRVVAGFGQVFAGVRRHRPIVVLPGAVDAGEGLLVEQRDEAVIVGG